LASSLFLGTVLAAFSNMFNHRSPVKSRPLGRLLSIQGTFTGRKRGGKTKSVDYLLLYQGKFPIAVVEVKGNSRAMQKGLKQAIHYAKP
jgi:type I site-specific restriction endonuclease